MAGHVLAEALLHPLPHLRTAGPLSHLFTPLFSWRLEGSSYWQDCSSTI